MPAIPVTKAQMDLLYAIEDFGKRNPFPPIVEDVREGYDSKIVLDRLIALEKKGYIEIVRLRRRIRALILLCKP